MRFLFYTHSLVSDWNHGNAHFLRGVMRELLARGHEAKALEPKDGWSRAHLLAERGVAALTRFAQDFPMLEHACYGADFHHEDALDSADVVVVHEWTDPDLVARIGAARRDGGRFILLFHDTHHRAVSSARDIGALRLEHYDGVLAFGESLREAYLAAGWGRRVFTWHEAADAALFRPRPELAQHHDLVWIGNWGDGERSAELREFLIEPIRALGVSANIHGVRYPREAQTALREAGARYLGFLPNAEAPACFARHRVTVHVPRRPYVEALPGIPTIRMFEALACGMPLVSAPWNDCEGLFEAGRDYLVAHNGAQMAQRLFDLLWDQDYARAIAQSGLQCVLERHTCAHRARELEAIVAHVGGATLRSMEAAR